VLFVSALLGRHAVAHEFFAGHEAEPRLFRLLFAFAALFAWSSTAFSLAIIFSGVREEADTGTGA
jgi:hypothetical protein